MRLKDKILAALEDSDTYLSGEGLASLYGVSRAAVWKAIKALQQEGYQIKAVPKRGYFLDSYGDRLDKEAILEAYHGKMPLEILCYETLESTNDLAKGLAEKGAHEWTVVLSESQTKGKGRLGRAFYSPKGSGIYMSILLRPNLPIAEASLLTLFGATIVSETISHFLDDDVQIKWVNDIFYQGKKVSGILTEASLSLEGDILDYLVLGIGINVTLDKARLSDELKPIVGSLYEEEVPKNFRNLFIGELLTRLANEYQAFNEKAFLERYRAYSMVLGKWVNIHYRDRIEEAEALEIMDDGALFVKMANGELRKINSGEVSLRMK